MILHLFQEEGRRTPEEPISFSTILATLSDAYTKGTLSARLSELVDEGILERSGRGDYRLVYARGPIPAALSDLVGVLVSELPERTLHDTVVWDATPVLADSEDGVMAPVQVVETKRFTAGATARILLDRWPGDDVPYVEEFAHRELLLDAAVGGTPVNAQAGKRRILMGSSDGFYAATSLLPAGVRVANPERILADLLWLDDPTAGDIARTRLTAKSTRLASAPLFSAADERNILPDLFAVLSSLRDELPDELRQAYSGRLRGAARTAAEGRRP